MRFAALLCLTILVPSVRAEPPTVADLVRQLGHNRFAVREAAEAELLRRGEAIVPAMEGAAKGADAETVERVRRIRDALIGYRDEIARLLAATVYYRSDAFPSRIHPDLRDLIARHQPRAADWLLTILADPRHPLQARARVAFLQAYPSATADQIDRYIQGQVFLTTNHRPKFPAKAGGTVPIIASIREGWAGWFSLDADKRLAITSRTTRYLDGKPYDKPFECREPFATVGSYRTGELPPGKHTIHAVLDYEFTHNGETRKGSIRSPDSTFEVVGADTPDDLIAPKSDELIKQVRTAFRIQETEEPAAERQRTGERGLADWWRPQMEWTANGKRRGIHGPVWRLASPLDVDLCFEVEIRDVATGKVFPSEPIIVPRKYVVRRGYVLPVNDPHEFARDRDGFVTVRVKLTPSRGLALSNPEITRYYPEAIETSELRMKVFADLNAPTTSK
jgi:hypothetical protein